MTRPRLETCRRIVVKTGSSLVQSGEAALAPIVADIAALRARGVEIVLVSSGAVALGRPRLGLTAPLTLEQKQAAAAAGQPELAALWDQLFQTHGLVTAQALITLDVTEHRRRWLNARATLDTLLGLNAVPIVNENDTVATDEIRYGDNDRLAARVAQLVRADLLILLSDIDGLYEADPRSNYNARKLDVIETIDDRIRAMAGPANLDAGTGTGGMRTKLAAAEIAAASGCMTVISHGEADQPLLGLENATRGSWFVGVNSANRARESWIAGAVNPAGRIIIDAGAMTALKAGRSLLPVGATGVIGAFSRGDTIAICGPDKQVLAHGISAYDSDDAASICGCQTAEIEHILGFRRSSAMVHADDLVLLDPKGRAPA